MPTPIAREFEQGTVVHLGFPDKIEEQTAPEFLAQIEKGKNNGN